MPSTFKWEWSSTYLEGFDAGGLINKLGPSDWVSFWILVIGEIRHQYIVKYFILQ